MSVILGFSALASFLLVAGGVHLGDRAGRWLRRRDFERTLLFSDL